MNSTRRSVIVILAIASVVILGGLLYLNSFQKLTIIYGDQINGVKTTIYRHEHDDDALPTDGDIVKEIANTTTFKLKRGSYLIVSSNTDDYAEKDQVVVLSDEPISIDVNPEYSEKKKKQVLNAESKSLRQQLAQQYPDTERFYTVGNEVLVNRGTWYGATLLPNSLVPEENKDVLRIVAQKKNSKWEYVMSFPEILVSKAQYPTIPAGVIKEVNRLPTN